MHTSGRSPRSSTPGRNRARVIGGLALCAVAGSVGVFALGGAAGANASLRSDVSSLAPMLPLRGEAISGQYIVVMKGAPAASAQSSSELRAAAEVRNDMKDWVENNGGTVGWDYDTVLNGFSTRLSDAKVSELRQNPDVAYVVPDGVMRAAATQNDASPGLDRIDQAALPLDNSFTFEQTAQNVTAFVIDTGILASHVDFQGRVTSGFTAINDGGGTTDCNGHGTHVAGTIGSNTFGVAKQVKLVAVRVLGCNGGGSTSGVIAGIDFVTRNHQGPSVANMSLGGPANAAVDAAVQNAIDSGVTFAVAAGNENQNACNVSPARLPGAITVGAIDPRDDQRANFSNFGQCVDVFAPGVGITSLFARSDRSIATLDGTSMASPHAAGVAALFLADNPTATPAQVAEAVTTGAVQGVVGDAGVGSPDRLLSSLLGQA